MAERGGGGRYAEHVGRVFSQLRRHRCVRERWELDRLRMVVFSDHHRGDRTGSDDFLRCEDVYHAALRKYHESGHKLVLLGDVEELWEVQPWQAVENYAATLELERAYVQDGRYLRVWGNHDDAWAHPTAVMRHLADFIGGSAGCPVVHEAVSIAVTDGGRRIGEIFFTHGHQGTFDSDRLAFVSRFVVRWLWRPVQRLFGVTLDTPAYDLRLRLGHEIAMHAWAAQQPGLILVAGHTHHPVFCSRSHESQLESEVAGLEREIEGAFGDRRAELRQTLVRRRHALAYLLEKYSGQMVERPDDVRPCYFNAGCCCFGDGDITGIEIADGEIRLVRWSREDGGGAARRDVLRAAGLSDLFRGLR